MRFSLVLAISILLAGCSTPPNYVQRIEYKVVEVPPDLFKCNDVKKLFESIDPNKTLTNAQVARLIKSLTRNNITCKDSLDQIKKFLSEAKIEIETNK